MDSDNQQEVPQQEVPEDAPQEVQDAPAEAPQVTTVYVGCGPNGKNIGKEGIREHLGKEINIVDIRVGGQGACYFVDVNSVNDANALIDGFNGEYLQDVRLAMRLADPSGAPRRGRFNNNEATNGEGPTTVYVGCGPNGKNIGSDGIREHLGKEVNIVDVRTAAEGACYFVQVDSASDANALIDGFNGQYLQDVRLAMRIADPRGPPRRRFDDDGRPGKEMRHEDNYYRGGRGGRGRGGDFRGGRGGDFRGRGRGGDFRGGRGGDFRGRGRGGDFRGGRGRSYDE